MGDLELIVDELARAVPASHATALAAGPAGGSLTCVVSIDEIEGGVFPVVSRGGMTRESCSPDSGVMLARWGVMLNTAAAALSTGRSRFEPISGVVLGMTGESGSGARDAAVRITAPRCSGVSGVSKYC